VDEQEASYIAEEWSGSGDLVPRGPRMLLACVPATAAEVERHTGRRPQSMSGLWRLEVAGRFLSSGAVVYPGGVPYPEDLQRQTALVANEVWLYADDSGRVLGVYWWPDAMRRPIASTPREEYTADAACHPDDFAKELEFELKVPNKAPWSASLGVQLSSTHAVVFCLKDTIPEPLNDMVVFEQGGLVLSERFESPAPDVSSFLRSHQPPYRRMSVGSKQAAGRDPGRALGPQTWPWPGELWWCDDGVTCELKGFMPLATLHDVAASMYSR
jgi:hypothetical protein